MKKKIKKILILGTGKDQIPGIKKVKEKGYYSVGLDMDNSSAGASLVDEFHPVNIKNESDVLSFCKQFKDQFYGVIAFGVDIPEIISAAAELLNCYNPIPVLTAGYSNNKLTAKKIMEKGNVKLPKFKGIASLNDLHDFIKSNGFPTILKPVDNSASRGVFQIHENTNIEKAYETSMEYIVDKTNPTPLIAEKFLTGKQLSTESILYNNKLYTIGIADRNYDLIKKYSPFIIENGGDLPASKEEFKNYEEMIDKIDSELMKVVKAFGLQNSVVKGDLVIHNGEIYVIEVAFRLSGGHFSTFEIPISTGVDFLSYAIDIYTGEKINTENLKFNLKKHVRLRYFLDELNTNHILKKLYLPNVNEVIADFYLQEGDFVKEFSSKLNLPVSKIGYYIVSGDTKSELLEREKKFLSKVKIEKGEQ